MIVDVQVQGGGDVHRVPVCDPFAGLSDLCKGLSDICKSLADARKTEDIAVAKDADERPHDCHDEKAEDLARPYLRSAPGVSEVLPHLLLGGAAALRPGLITKLGVTCVVNCASELPNTPLPGDVAYLRVPLVDHPSSSLHQHLDTVADAIEEVRLQGGRTLVHCLAGVSRSAALVLGYLVKHHSMPLSTAFQVVRAARPIARPNSGFFHQLIEWEQRFLGRTSVTMVRSPALPAPIPDVYEEDYRNMANFYNKYTNRTLSRV